MTGPALEFSTSRLPGLLENIVHAELRLRGYDVSIGKLGDAEVDLVAQRRDERIYVQVATTIADEQTRHRECAPLLAVQDSYRKCVLTADALAGGIEAGIRRMRIPDFLLDSTW